MLHPRCEHLIAQSVLAADHREGKVSPAMSLPPMGSPPFRLEERRAARRYDCLSHRIRVVPHKRLGLVTAESAISLRGIYFITDEEFTRAPELEFTVALPVGIPRVPKFLYTLTAVLRAEERREDRHHVHRRGCRYRKD